MIGREGEDNATCTVRGVKFSVSHGGLNDVIKHFSSKKHSQSVTAKKTSGTLASFGFREIDTTKRARAKQEELQQKIRRAEAQFAQFVAEHNLSFHIGDHFTKLVKSLFPECDVAKGFQSSRTNTSVLSRYGIGKYYYDKFVKSLTSSTPIYYSLLIDESNDREVEAKDLVIMLRFFDSRLMKAVTRFLDLPTANIGTAAGIFAKVDESLLSRGLSYDTLICFNSDTCNTTKGQHNGVVRHLQVVHYF